MSSHVLQGDPDIPLILRPSARARRITLRVSQVDGRVTVTLPRHVAEAEALAFAAQKEPWIRKHLDGRAATVAMAPGAVLPVAGQTVTLAPGKGRSVRLDGDVLMVPGAPEAMGPRVAGYLKARARDTLAAASDHYAARAGRSYSGLSLRDTRSRWGSCSSSGRLMYSWRLILAPPRVLDYVAAHEVAHLAQMNHSPRFWAEVERIHGPYAEPRQWLRANGAQLHRYSFGD
ncbi:SprT family zinc-dependent metalloprotease [uncultured Tateyamaria sp.]|uniref:M48 family metallopeptidase n=1 Tax=Tateyamaria sp. 1078 TaxID=3417464 RepID=UPI00262EDA78|nr:SprT family zinc-dependent metalloprotease [uncultured Tateyamaria sp.]